MLAMLIALGVIPTDSGTVLPPTPPAGSGPLIAPPEAIVAIPRLAATTAVGSGIPLGAPIWKLPLDPSDQAPFAWDFTGLLDDGASIASVERLTMSAAGAAVGVEIVETTPCNPVITEDGKHVQVWFLVDTTDQALATFADAGVLIGVAVLIGTDQTPPRYYERTAVLVLRQL